MGERGVKIVAFEIMRIWKDEKQDMNKLKSK